MTRFLEHYKMKYRFLLKKYYITRKSKEIAHGTAHLKVFKCKKRDLRVIFGK